MIPIRSTTMRPGDRVIWLHSKKRSFVVGWRVQQIPAAIVRICRWRIGLKVLGTERIVNVSPDSVISEDDG